MVNNPEFMLKPVMLFLLAGLGLAALFGLIVLFAVPRTRVLAFLLAGLGVILAVTGLYFVRSSKGIHWTNLASERTVAERRPASIAPDDPELEVSLPRDPPLISDAHRPGDPSTPVGTPSLEKSSPSPAARPAVDPARPAWVGAAAERTGETYYLSVSSGRWETQEECELALNERMQQALAHCIDAWFLHPGASQYVKLQPAYIRDELMTAQFVEELPLSINPVLEVSMKQVHARLAIDRADREEIQRLWRAGNVGERLQLAGAGTAVVLVVLSAAFAALKLL